MFTSSSSQGAVFKLGMPTSIMGMVSISLRRTTWLLLLLVGFCMCRGSSSSSSSSNSNNLVHQLVQDASLASCEDILQRATHQNIKAQNPPQLQGKWVSQSCESRPGNQNVLRSYEFNGEGEFSLLLHHYRDPSCAHPSHTLHATGTLTTSRDSWVTPGGISADYTLNSVTVVPHSHRSSQSLSKTVNSTCPTMVMKPWKAGKAYTVVAYSESNNEVTQDEDCQRGLGAAWNELQLIRVEETAGQNGALTRELFLGDIHTNLKRQELYRPTGYQQPLIMAKHHADCPVCQMVGRSSERSPAHLHAQPALPPLLAGSWVSRRCETRPYGMFLTRQLTFSRASQEWVMTLNYYHAPGCYRPSFSIQARGTYIHTQPSPYAYDFLVKYLLMTPEDETMAAALNAYKGKECGRPGQWFVGRSQDVTPTGGCASVGIRVPLVEREIIMMGTDVTGGMWLRLGQTATTSQQLDVAPRPTSWGPPLQQCRAINQNDIDNSLQPMMGARIASHATRFSPMMIMMSLFMILIYQL